jgi:hypothetical protein
VEGSANMQQSNGSDKICYSILEGLRSREF